MPTRRIPVPQERLRLGGGDMVVDIIEREGTTAWVVLTDAAGFNSASQSQTIAVDRSLRTCAGNDLGIFTRLPCWMRILHSCA